jgi:hypothetical protein
MSRHLVIAVSTGTGQVILNKNPLEVLNDDEIRWTSNDGDIRVELPAELVGRPASEPPEIREALKERLTAPVVVKANPALREDRVWYRYDVFLTTSSGTAQANAFPHVIVTSP